MGNEAKNNEKKFWEFVGTVKEAFEGGFRANLALWLGVWNGEKARERAVREDEPATEFAFELGCQLRPVWGEIDKAVRSALVGAAVTSILGYFGLKK